MRIVAAFLFATAWVVPATAAPFTWIVQGQLSSVNQISAGQYIGLFAAGQPYTLSLTMESTAPDLIPSPACGSYAPIQFMTFTSGSVSLSTSPVTQSYVVNPSGPGLCDLVDNLISIKSDFSRLGPQGALAFDLTLAMTLSFLDDSLLTDSSKINGFILDLFATRPEGNVPPAFTRGFGGSVTPVTAVPEPGSLSMLSMALALTWRRARCRRPA